MQPDDSSLLVDMLVAATRALDRAQAASLEEFEADVFLQGGLLHQVQTIGEAASRVSPSYREAHPEIPWADIIGMRHRIVHGYSQVDFDIVWSTVTEDLPGLIRVLRRLTGDEGA